jgi:hypothetical protein
MTFEGMEWLPELDAIANMSLRQLMGSCQTSASSNMSMLCSSTKLVIGS